jgi:AraC-like DNA-binding protein
VSDALLQSVKAYALDRLDDPDLDAGRLAAVHGLPVRCLTRLFRATGTSASSWLRRERLECCAAALREDAAPPLTDLAHRWCFADATHLALAFRAEFGRTPTEYRRGFLS